MSSSSATEDNISNETVIEYLEKYLGKLSDNQKDELDQVLGIKTTDDLLFLEEDMLLSNNNEEIEDYFTPIQKRKLITIASYMKLSLSSSSLTDWTTNISLSDMFQYVNNFNNATQYTSKTTKKVKPNKNNNQSVCLNKPKAEAQLDDNDLFSRHLVVTKYEGKAMEGKGYLLLFPPEWHKSAEETLQTWPSSWEVWQFCRLNSVDMFFPAPSKMVHEGGYLKIELDDEVVSDLWSLCTSTWNVDNTATSTTITAPAVSS